MKNGQIEGNRGNPHSFEALAGWQKAKKCNIWPFCFSPMAPIDLARQGASQNSIALSRGYGQSTVSDVLRAARARRMSWPRPEEMDDAAMRAAIYLGPFSFPEPFPRLT